MSDSDLQITIGVDARSASSGAEQAKSAVAGVAAQVQALSGVFGSLSKDFTDGLDGLKKVSAAFEGFSKGAQQAQSAGGALRGLGADISSLAGKAASSGSGIARFGAQITAGLSEAVAEGAGKLALLGDAASGFVGIAMAVGQAALMAGQATLEWAQHAQNSATATTQQRANAAELVAAWNGANAAAAKVGAVFDSVGASLASAFAPAVTAVINILTGLANAFADSYTNGGLLKSAVDLVTGAVDVCSKAVVATIDAWKLEADVASDFGRLASDAVKAVQTIVQDLQTKLTNELAPAFKAVQGAAETAWNGVQTGFGVLLKFVEVGYQNWKRANQPLVEAIKGIGGAFGAVQKTAQGAIQWIIDKVGELANALLGLVDKLPGVSAAFKQLRDDLATSLKQTQGNLAALRGDVGLGGPAAAPPASSPPAGDKRSQAPAGHATAPGGIGGPASDGGERHGCDPAAAAACATQTQNALTTAANVGVQQRTSANAAANADITADNNATTGAYATNQAQQLDAAEDADRAKVASNNAANRQITEANDKALKQFKSSMNKLVNTFADGLVKMAEGSKSFGQVMRQLGQQILDDVFRVVIGMVEKWAWGETEKVLATQRGQMLLQALGLKDLALEIANDTRKVASNAAANAAKVASNNTAAAAGQAAQLALTLTTLKQDAAKVFGGIFAALSNNPFTLPAAAPAAAAGAAAVMSYNLAAGGYDIPAGVNPLTQLHAQEMVLPARLANPMRDMLASFGSAGAPAPGGHSFSFGDTHIHGAPNMSPGDFKQALAEHRANVAGAVADALRSGWRPSYRQPVGAL